MSKSRIRLVGHVARSGREALHTRFLWGSLWERDDVEDLAVGGSIIQKKLSSRKTGLNWSGWGQGDFAGCCEEDNDPTGFIKCGEFVDYLRNYYLLNNSAPWGKLLLLRSETCRFSTWGVITMIDCNSTKSYGWYRIGKTINLCSTEIGFMNSARIRR